MLVFSGCFMDTNINVDEGLICDVEGNCVNVTANAANMVLYNSNGNPVTVSNENTLVIMDELHYRNHQGNFWTASASANLNTGQTSEFMMCVDNVTEFHFVDFTLSVSGGPVNIELYEDPTLTNNGTAFNLTNMNRGFRDKNQTVDTYVTPTYTAPGFLLFEDAITGGTGQAAKITAPFDLSSEWILVDGCFLFIITNNDGNNNDIYINFFGYEE